jgi:hypothetical protein
VEEDQKHPLIEGSLLSHGTMLSPYFCYLIIAIKQHTLSFEPTCE